VTGDPNHPDNIIFDPRSAMRFSKMRLL